MDEAGGEEFQVPVEPAPDDGEIPATEQPADHPVHAEQARARGRGNRPAPRSAFAGRRIDGLPIPDHAEVAARRRKTRRSKNHKPALPEAPPPQPELELDQEFELVLEPEEVAAPYEMLSEVPLPKRQSPRKSRRRRKRKSQIRLRLRSSLRTNFFPISPRKSTNWGWMNSLRPCPSRTTEHEAVEPSKEQHRG